VAAPVVADQTIAVDDQELPAALGQVVVGGQARLAGTAIRVPMRWVVMRPLLVRVLVNE
jgi:hypothetical protein